MTTDTWILLANSTHARLIDDPGPGKPLTVLREFEHPEGRAKGLELVTDRPSRNAQGGNDSAMYTQRTDPRRAEREHFAHELTEVLDEGRRRGDYAHLVLVASNPFLGMLTSELDDSAKAMVTQTVPHDYLMMPLEDLKPKLRELRGAP
jgi:protein required for attachment to host cells